MTIDVNYKSDYRTYEIMKDGEKIANVPLAFCGNTSAPDLAAAFKAVYETSNSFISDTAKNDFVYASLGLLGGSSAQKPDLNVVETPELAAQRA